MLAVGPRKFTGQQPAGGFSRLNLDGLFRLDERAVFRSLMVRDPKVLVAPIGDIIGVEFCRVVPTVSTMYEAMLERCLGTRRIKHAIYNLPTMGGAFTFRATMIPVPETKAVDVLFRVVGEHNGETGTQG